jgi:CxxC motif-containing protein (DUF1111 family)
LNNQVTNNNNDLGISGAFNRNGNDGTITRFGWKAQNKSLHIFSGEAYNVEMGISNLLFPQDRPLPGEDQQATGLPSTCLNLSGSGYPEDSNNPGSAGAAVLDDVSAFADFMRRAQWIHRRFVDDCRRQLTFRFYGLRDLPQSHRRNHTGVECYFIVKQG